MRNHPWPVLVLPEGKHATPLNSDGEALIASLNAQNSRGADKLFAELNAEAHARSMAIIHQISLHGLKNESDCASNPDDESADGNTFEIAVVPNDDGSSVLVARDTTFQTNVQTALIESRQRYRELISLACDFVWEADAAAKITFISPEGAIGFDADDLLGLSLGKLFPGATGLSDNDEFAADWQEEIRSREIWTHGSHGEEICLEIAAKPVIDPLGDFTGMRGVARDVTDRRLRREDEARQRLQERTVDYIVRIADRNQNSDAMLEALTSAIMPALSADACAIYRLQDGNFTVIARAGERIGRRYIERISDDLSAGVLTSEIGEDGIERLGIPTFFNTEINSAIIVWRRVQPATSNIDDQALFRSIGTKIGHTLNRIFHRRTLETLSQADELTGLLNRRGFMNAINTRIETAKTDGKAGALLYIDLDNLKSANDLGGHDHGDEVLIRLANFLKERSRDGDVVGRLGGDEFALWLSNCEPVDTLQLGERLLDAKDRLADLTMDPEKPLGVSVGAANFDPNGAEVAEILLSRADAAMYEAKHSGKGRFVVAPATGQSPSKTTPLN